MMSDPRFVFDTNTLVSALLLADYVSRRAFDKARHDGQLIISPALLSEPNDVLGRDKFDKYITRTERFIFMIALVESALLVDPQESIQACRDPRDDMVLELAVAGDAMCIVSGDLDLLVLSPFRGIEVLRPSDFTLRQFI